MEMGQYKPIFEDASTPVDEILAAIGSAGWLAKSIDVGVMQAAHAIDGEMWAPQLTPYTEWKPRGDGRSATEHDGDLFKVGSLHMGADNELRERMVALGLEAARKMAEQAKVAAEQAEELPVDPDVIDLPLVFGVKEGNDGFVLSKVDLRQYAKRSGRDRDLVVLLPSHVEGVPVTRIDADAFSRFNVRGIGVRLLVVPDSVTSVDANAFSYLAAQTIAIGAGCRNLGAQPVERWALKPTIDRRAYEISPHNEWWESRDGSVVSKDGTNLLFLAPPYGKRVAIPDGVQRVGAEAFAKWDVMPEVVECGPALERVASKLWDGALWLCPQDAPMFEVLVRRNVRIASHDVVTVDNCWYDFDEGGALLVSGPPAPPSVSQTFARAAAAMSKGDMAGSSPAAMAKQLAHAAPQESVLTVPRAVKRCATMRSRAEGESASASLAVQGDVAGQPAYGNGVEAGPAGFGGGDIPMRYSLEAAPAGEESLPVTRIAPRALVTAPETVILPEGLASVGHDNACKGTRRLSLPQSLRRIEAHCFCSRELEGVTSVPAGVLSIGEGCFEYGIVRLEHTGTIVHISANQLLNCFVERTDDEMAALEGAGPAERVPFDFERYDRMLCEGANLPGRIGALVHRIASPVGLADAARNNLVGQLKANAQEAMEYVAREGDAATVARLADAGFIDGDIFDAQIELLRRFARTDCVMLLMERRHGSASAAPTVKSRFAL